MFFFPSSFIRTIFCCANNRTGSKKNKDSFKQRTSEWECEEDTCRKIEREEKAIGRERRIRRKESEREERDEKIRTTKEGKKVMDKEKEGRDGQKDER